MTRQKEKHIKEQAAADRKARINKLLTAGWITNAADIPPDAIPVDPDRLTLGGWDPPTFYRDLDFTCKDCGEPQTWTAEDQRWYFETTGAPYLRRLFDVAPAVKRNTNARLWLESTPDMRNPRLEFNFEVQHGLANMEALVRCFVCMSFAGSVVKLGSDGVAFSLS